MTTDSLPVRHLFTMEATIGDPPPSIIANGPLGTRVIVGVTGGVIKGERINGSVVPLLGGDFALMRPDGTLRLDVRLVLTTDDGATIYLTYNGVGTQDEGGLTIKTAPTFECGDERYAWLNNIQAIGVGNSNMVSTLNYEVYELL
jgi:hypothetical protein